MNTALTPTVEYTAKQSPNWADASIDGTLVERFLIGQKEAFDELVRRHQRSIYYLALRYVNNDADAADITQKTFVRVFKSLHTFRGTSSFRTWLYRIAINQSLNHLRDHRREQATEIQDDVLTTAPTGAARVIAGQESATLRAAIAQLPPKQRLVLELRIYDELSFRDVASVAQCTENAAKVNFHHAVKRLRGLLAQDENTAAPKSCLPTALPTASKDASR